MLQASTGVYRRRGQYSGIIAINTSTTPIASLDVQQRGHRYQQSDTHTSLSTRSDGLPINERRISSREVSVNPKRRTRQLDKPTSNYRFAHAVHLTR